MQRHANSPLFLGIDTGGTYTDAVLWADEAGGKGKILAKAKALTTRHDLAVGIGGAVDAVLKASKADVSAIKLVSMSTTLATNALVEGQGGRVALVMIGFSEADASRDGLKAALGSDPVVFCPGGHDVHGNETRMDLSELENALPALEKSVSGFAVCAYFSTRNPAHELAALQLIRDRTHLPATASHQLTSKLGGPRRALTTLLNARLVSMIDRLIEATQGFLASRGIEAPLMVVRGDGALVSAAFARERPIETILSGPAASLVGARHLTGLNNAVVSDIGGTTTDVAVLDKGRPRLDPEGATVGGFRTMVEAVAMRTFGLGGDSEVSLEEGALEPRIRLGPRRLVPLALAGQQHAAVVLPELERQLNASNPGRLDGRFAFRTGAPQHLEAGLDANEAKLFAAIAAEPRSLDRLLTSNAQSATLSRLVGRGLVHIVGFTPSDAAHVLGLQANWNAETARLGAELFARRRDGRGQPVAPNPEHLARRVLDTLTRASADVILETAFAEDGLDGAAMAGHALIERAIEGRSGIARLAVSLDRPVVGLGASASLHYAGLPMLLNADCIMPPDADVANALGAVVGHVRVSAAARVSQPVEGLFRLNSDDGVRDFHNEADALREADSVVRRLVAARAVIAGANDPEIVVEQDIRTSAIEDQRMFIEADVVAVASGRPAIAT
ncbi:MAG: hydantoinase/oxoprolinase N-terminal domain-containing protein [Rhizobiaceae bacterium]